ncbi:alpha/beta hydrolase [Nocardia sp. CDC159]|uniref:Alpha/beta hydrolase n=1 Tax=Nocardia pulmonis TaxID=2951408 RepID=A0A9X2ECW1_9NOCA|nr:MULTISPECIES: alpha/beta hydrolase [Nocardia]MCM6778572.1 alpha/beta hydrolase [Nocardia pulmonis]MCM6791461.1 alpha/beta hydrolase [Nocardia sp. CDC159]
MRRFGRRRFIAAVLSIAALFAVGWIGAPVALADDFAPGDVPLTGYAPFGPHRTVSTAAVYPCAGLYAAWNALGQVSGNHSPMTCTREFPGGLDSPIGVDFYYPEDIASMSRVPTIIWVPGFTSEPGNYDSTARFWASHGFVVAMPHDFVNSLFELPLAGAAALSHANHDPANPLHGRLDLSRTVIGGHSGGGGAAVNGASIPPNIYQLVDPEFRVVGAMPTEPGPVAAAFLVNVPTLYLAGSFDLIVPHFLPRLVEYEVNLNAPAYFICLKGVTHFTPFDDATHNATSGITLAWLNYLVNGDKTAASYFVGPDWKLRNDPGVDYALRNVRAEHWGA